MIAEAAYDNAILLKRLESVIDTDPYCIITPRVQPAFQRVALNHRGTIDFADWLSSVSAWTHEVMGSLAPSTSMLTPLNSVFASPRRNLVIIPTNCHVSR